jgi:hypothetical protein
MFMMLPVWRWMDPVPVLESWEKASRRRHRERDRDAQRSDEERRFAAMMHGEDGAVASP